MDTGDADSIREGDEMSSSYGRLAAIRDYWMPRNLDARVEVRVTDIDEILRELVRVTTLAAERAAPTPPVQQDDEALEPDMQSAWISVQDRMPPDDTPVLVYVPGNELLAFAIDQWQMQREAPLGWSSATIETGMGWGDHDYEDVSHWMPLTAPGHPLDPDDQGIVDEYDVLLRMIDEAMGETE